MWITKIWNWISNPTNIGIIGSIASIIGLPIALWQLRDVKTKVQASQKAVNSMIDSLKYKNLESVLERLKAIHDRFVKLKGKIGERGQNMKSIHDSIDSIILDLNHCDHDLPTGFESVSNAIRDVVEKMEQLQQSEDKKSSLGGSEDSIRKAIGVMKTEIDKGNKDRLIASSK